MTAPVDVLGERAGTLRAGGADAVLGPGGGTWGGGRSLHEGPSGRDWLGNFRPG